MSERTDKFESDQFIDHRGLEWFCAQRSGSRTIVCHSVTNHMTAADPETFKRWGWKRKAAPDALPQHERGDG